MNPGLHSIQEGILPGRLVLEGTHDLFVHGALGDEMVDHHSLFLSLPPETGVGLLVQFQRPG